MFCAVRVRKNADHRDQTLFRLFLDDEIINNLYVDDIIADEFEARLACGAKEGEMTEYRNLEAGEIIQEGDEADASRLYNDDAKWLPVAQHSIGKSASDPRCLAHTIYRRPYGGKSMNDRYDSGTDSLELPFVSLSYAHVPMTKEDQKVIGTAFSVAITEEGQETALEGYIKLKAMLGVVEAAISALADDARNEADLYTNEDAKVLHGVKFTVTDGAARYSYVGDSEWESIKAEEKSLSEKRKKRESLLRALETAVVDPDTGEISTPAIQTSMGNRQLRVTFQKR